jgi:phosphohistidine swiveling domain-containing protein
MIGSRTATGLIEFPIPTDVDAFWQFDRVHAPRPLTPLSQEVLLPAFGDGITAAFEEMAYPHTFIMRAVNNFAYLGFVVSSKHGAALEQQLELHQRTVAPIIPQLADLWERVWLPSILPGLERLRTVEYGSLSDVALLELVTDLRMELAERWRIHGRILLAYLAASNFEDFYRDRLNPTDPTEPYRLLHGFPTRALDSSRGLWRLSRVAAETPVLRHIVENTPPSSLPEVLAQTAAGCAFLGELYDYLEIFGWRNDAFFELADPTWREDPTRPLAAIQGQLALDADADPDAHFERAARERNELVQRARGRLAGDPAVLARFDELYAQARCYLAIDEDHNFYIDQMGNVGLRRPLLELGRRLASRGAIAAPEDVFLLHLDEVGVGLSGVDQQATAATRRADLQHWATVAPPETLGVPPADDVADPFLVGVSKQDATPPATAGGNSPGVLTGTPASAGVATGRARVARSLTEACAVQPGEVLVCEMTLPTWTPLFATIAAVVSDSGGVLSHCAIVAREAGIPCVVGTHVATRTIANGMLLTVDGARGTVQIHAGRFETERPVSIDAIGPRVANLVRHNDD